MARRVYSTDDGDLRKARPQQKRDHVDQAHPPGRVKVRRETAGRKGKGVTTITGVPVSDEELKALTTKLKKRCGVGGSAKGGVIELQGDHRDIVVEVLRAEGYDVVLAGG